MKSNIGHIQKWILRSGILFCSMFILLFSQLCIAQDGEAIFKQNCAACHKVGGGRMVGPDLIGITEKRPEEWLIKWTKSSQSLIKSGDADAKAIFDEFGGIMMPDQALSDAEIKSILAFISSKSTASTASAETKPADAAPVHSSENATPDVIELGKNLFTGSVAFTSGGPACLSCHNVDYKGVIAGGLLAKDLTTVYSRLGGDAGLLGILGAPPFPAMTQAYKAHPLTEAEITALSAFFYSVDKDTVNQVAGFNNYLLFGGGGGLVGMLILIYVIWFIRKKNSVKKDIYDRQLKSI
ncbi:MAG: c-type cytochrome [Crocinitomicaceae bacterium]|nr:c-type cytochrome [Crocinitomicaceae bacterium]